MRLSYDSVSDSLYIGLSDALAANSYEIGEDLVEVDEDERMVAISISNATTRVDFQTISIE